VSEGPAGKWVMGASGSRESLATEGDNIADALSCCKLPVGPRCGGARGVRAGVATLRLKKTARRGRHLFLYECHVMPRQASGNLTLFLDTRPSE
jgi:hypothetical protein